MELFVRSVNLTNQTIWAVMFGVCDWRDVTDAWSIRLCLLSTSHNECSGCLISFLFDRIGQECREFLLLLILPPPPPPPPLLLLLLLRSQPFSGVQYLYLDFCVCARLAYLFIYLFIHLFMLLFIYLFVCLFVFLFVYLLAWGFVAGFFFVCLFVCLFVCCCCCCVCLFVCLFVCLVVFFCCFSEKTT